MKKYIVLLRGINIAGQKKVSMAQLREILKTAGLQNIQTYIQSGNIIIHSEKSRGILSELINSCIRKSFGFDVSVIVQTDHEWQQIIENNPFEKHTQDPDYFKKLNITFLKKLLPESIKEKIIERKNKNEELFFTEKYLYGWYGNGFGRSNIAGIISKYPEGTTRNWNSITKIHDL